MAAWSLSLGFLFCLVANMLMALAVNRWSKDFFDALQIREMGALVASVETLALLAGATALVAIATLQCRMRLQLGWRLWLSRTLIVRWLQRGHHLTRLSAVLIDNPEARIADDTRLAVELFVDISGGMINTFLVSASFIYVLWHVGGSIVVHGLEVPGFLVLSVVVYAGVTSASMWFLGRPLVRSVEDKAAAEGNFRYELTRTRERLEGGGGRVAAAHGIHEFRETFLRLAERWLGVIRGQTRIVFLTSANNLFAPVVPLILCAPKYMSGAMTLGDVMQATAAFVQVQTSLNWLADNALSLANWSASANRVAALDIAMTEILEVPALPPEIEARRA